MKLLIVSRFKSTVKDTDILPRVGDKIDVHYYPYPSVDSVLLYPSKETLQRFDVDLDIDAVITVD